MIISIRKIKNEVLITLCDEDIIGKKLNFNGVEVYINPKFYRGEKRNEKEIKELLKKATIINAIGKKSVDFCLKEGYIDKKGIIDIDGVPHAQMFLIPRNL